MSFLFSHFFFFFMLPLPLLSTLFPYTTLFRSIEGHDLSAGTYGFFIALGEKESTLIFSKVNNSWGSFYYDRSEEHTSELQSLRHLVCRLLLEKKKKNKKIRNRKQL